MGKKILFILSVLFACCGVSGQNTLIKGVVTDSLTGEALPYASLLLKGTSVGTITNETGKFSLSTSARSEILEVSYLGYDTKDIKIVSGKTNDLKIQLVPTGIALNEVIVKPKKERYSKKENPAVIFVRKVIEARNENDPHNHDYFQYDRYERMVFAMNDYKPKAKKDGKPGKFDFLSDFVDTLEIGTTILPISEKEKIETVFFRKDPESEKRIVKGNKSAGVDEVFSRDGIQQFLNEAFKEVDIFKNNIPLFLQRFVSPLSTIGPNFYKYYLLDTLEVNGKKSVDLGFVPFNSESFGFTGHLYVALDSTFFVNKVILNVPKDINLNFVSQMTIEQTFQRTSNNTRVITKDDIRVNFKLSEKSKGMYAQRLNIYSNYAFGKPEGEYAQIFEESAPILTLEDAYRRSDSYWAENRPESARKKNPNSVEKLMTKLRSVPVFYITEKVVSTLVSGYIPTNKNPEKNKFDLGPMNSTINGNAIEGARFRIGGGTTPVFNKNWFFEGYAAYGTRDKKMKYDGYKLFGVHLDQKKLDIYYSRLQNIINTLGININVRAYTSYPALMEAIMYKYGCFENVYELAGPLAQRIREKLVFPVPHTDDYKPFYSNKRLYYIDLNGAYLSCIKSIPAGKCDNDLVFTEQNTKIKDLIQHLYSIRKELQNKDDILAGMIKLLMTCCWGMSIKREKLFKKHYPKNREEFIDRNLIYAVEFNDEYVKTISSLSIHWSYPQFAREVLNEFENKMKSILDIVNHVYYHNVDAILIDEDGYKKVCEAGLIGDELGKFKIEHIFDEIAIMSKRKYVATLDDGTKFFHNGNRSTDYELFKQQVLSSPDTTVLI